MRATRVAFRLAVTTVVALAGVSAPAGPALAKIDLRAVTVAGPGLGAPIVFRGQDAWAVLVAGDPGAPPRRVGPRGALGPKYELRLNLQMESPVTWTLPLYPFADTGPVLRVGYRQELQWLIEWNDRRVHTPWIEVLPRQLELLQARGFPRAAPETVASPVAQTPAMADEAEPVPDEVTTRGATGSAGVGPAVAIGGAALLVGGALIGRRALMRRPG